MSLSSSGSWPPSLPAASWPCPKGVDRRRTAWVGAPGPGKRPARTQHEPSGPAAEGPHPKQNYSQAAPGGHELPASAASSGHPGLWSTLSQPLALLGTPLLPYPQWLPRAPRPIILSRLAGPFTAQPRLLQGPGPRPPPPRPWHILITPLDTTPSPAPPKGLGPMSSLL